MSRFLRSAVLIVAATGILPAQFHLPGLSGNSSPKPASPAPATKSPTPSAATPDAPSATASAASRTFDYYALTITWVAGKVAVRGLAPRINQGRSPESCGPAKPASKNAIAVVATLIPDRNAAQQEWMKHGACTGSTPADYFNTLRFTRSLVQIPVQLTSPDADTPPESPKLVEAWFSSANPRFPAGAFRAAAAEIEICFDLQLKPQACPTGSK